MNSFSLRFLLDRHLLLKHYLAEYPLTQFKFFGGPAPALPEVVLLQMRVDAGPKPFDALIGVLQLSGGADLQDYGREIGQGRRRFGYS